MIARALGVYRESEFSPGKVDADAAILDLVLTHLAAHGVGTAAVSAAEVIDNPGSGSDLILAMCQSEQALKWLAMEQKAGALIINSPQAIRSCYRDRMGQILTDAAAPVPPGILVETFAPIDRCTIDMLDLERGIYIKRGDLHALSADDVCRADQHPALAGILQDFAARGIRHAYLQQAVEGRVIKFYGVTGTGYFSLANAESITTAALNTRLHTAAQAAATALGLDVWGGDAIIDGEQFKLVDFNDWPSFERVRAPAAAAIARRVLDLMAMRSGSIGR